MGHICPELDRYPRRMTAEQWLPLAEGRNVYVPVRDPAEASWSLKHVHGFAWDRIRESFAEMVKFIKAADPIRVDIRELKPQNVKGNRDRDEIGGAELLRDFPEYFEDFY